VPSAGHVKRYPMRERRVMRKANRKVLLLLVPLLIVPLVATGYAHFTDEVIKKYKIHVGSVYLNITGVHVDSAKMPDVNNNGVIFGDELNITVYESADCRWYELITADPITGGFELNTTTWMINGGKLPFTLMWTAMWDGPYPSDPCFDVPPGKDLTTLPMPPWSFSITLYKWHLNPTTKLYERTGPWAPTETDYKPGDFIQVIQHVDFAQPSPGDTYQKDWQCKWIKIWVTFHAQDTWTNASSWQWGTLGPF
jgi:hypothetical protein